jgi:hypothetical protein
MKKNTINFKYFKKLVEDNNNDADLGNVMRGYYWKLMDNHVEDEKSKNL